MNTITSPPTAKPLSPRQLEVLKFIRDYIAANQCGPTMQTIADALGVAKVTIHETINTLERKGWITREKHKTQSIRIVEDVCPTCGRKCERN